ncbi:hypothetical protein, variant [Aphanomyces invadans]|uniref:Mitochondrial carrier protein n=1 Tax=Aphanomyces invadans TaxID=157072 RepID=A0A024U9U3_9STRA|nr:hypothetical protein, variant [Aphanomyces invadans]ETW02960.1 hypothetical protein, variant [Aphanomyces invadans]|eukprot:XP_008868344.1 hypothetical protein, variant [Aphanomyces invadans]
MSVETISRGVGASDHIVHDSQQLTAHLPTAETHATLYKSMVSGAVAGMVTDSVLLPFDTVNLRIKVQMVQPHKYTGIAHAWKTILREEGVAGFFGGLGTTLKMAPINTAVYYTAYEFAKTTIASRVSKEHEPVAFFAAGAFSELCSSITNVPTEVLKARMQLGRNPNNASGGWMKETTNYRGTVDAVRSIVRTEGLRGLYSGYGACLAVDASYSGFAFLFYEMLKQYHRDTFERSPSPAETTCIGGIAGGAAAFLTNPLDIITLRLMTQGNSNRYRGLVHCLHKSLAEEGISIVWKGSACRMMSVIPGTGISFGVYETVKAMLIEEGEDF